MKKIKKIFYIYLLPSFFYWILRVYSFTFRFSVKNEKEWLILLENEPVLLACWHQQFLAAIHYFHKYKQFSPNIMISQSKDGELIAKVAAKSHWVPVRGSSSKGAVAAAKAMVRAMRQTHLRAHVVDGPRGPMGQIKPGLVEIAALSGSWIVPFYLQADRAWHTNSWDYFMIPKPFAKVQLIFGSPISVKRERQEGLNWKQITEKIQQTMLPYLINKPKRSAH